MSAAPFTKIHSAIFGRNIHFDGFSVSWAGENTLDGEYWYGSEDGRFRTSSGEGFSDPVSPSGEAINGIAFANRTIAFSTRCDVSFLLLDEQGVGSRLLFNRGAHGIIATGTGGFVAPLGVNGLLTMKRIHGPEQLLATAKMDSKPINFYKLTQCTGTEQQDLIVGAARGDGLLVMELDSFEDRIIPGRSQFMRTPGLDVIDACSLHSPDWPRAIAWLGIDNSIHLSRDILSDQPTKSLRIRELEGTAYTILHAQGHLLLLTSKTLYIFPNFVSLYLSDELEGGLAPVLVFDDSEIADVCATFRNILIQRNDHLQILALADIIPEVHGIGHVSGTGWKPEFSTPIWDRSIESKWSSEYEKPAA